MLTHSHGHAEIYAIHRNTQPIKICLTAYRLSIFPLITKSVYVNQTIYELLSHEINMYIRTKIIDHSTYSHVSDYFIKEK
jgi:hypothetical protein